MSLTQSVTMANSRPEDGSSSIWSGYSLHPPPPTTSHPPAFMSNYPSSTMSISYHGRPQKSNYRSLDIPPSQLGLQPRDGSGVLTASPPPLNTHHSFPSLKRPFHTLEDMPYAENVQPFREDMSDMAKPQINQDHRLLSFARLPEKHTLLDSQGRAQRVELAAQIHGMFFLSELATPPGENSMVQPELTCYRRNLFQISGSATTPRGPLSLLTDRGERIAVVSMEVAISATESVDGHVVKLIVIPWKTPPPNSPEIPSGQEHEPSPIPLLPFDESPDAVPADGESAVFPIAYRRLQFRIATANNGRRRELQQHFTLHLNVVGTLANGTKVDVCETSTAPIVVRGRSPRNFQARKEIPLVGSSSSRGQPPELHAATNMMPQNAADGKAGLPKPRTMELPRAPFTFDSSSISGSPLMVRQSNYQSWNTTTPAHTASPNAPNYTAPIESYLQVANPPQHHPDATPASMSSAPPSNQRPYTYQSHPPSSAPPPPLGQMSQTPPRFIDGNPRPAKSPRHIAHPELPGLQHHSSTSYSDYAPRFAAPYHGAHSGQIQEPPRTLEYFPPIVGTSMGSWTSGPDPNAVYVTQGSVPPGSQYAFPGEQQYAKEETGGQSHYPWNPT